MNLGGGIAYGFLKKMYISQMFSKCRCEPLSGEAVSRSTDKTDLEEIASATQTAASQRHGYFVKHSGENHVREQRSTDVEADKRMEAPYLLICFLSAGRFLNL